jgi:cellulose synthase operon protein C
VPGLTLGVNAAVMHYDRNLSFFSLGQGGYFSPQKYYLGSIPISWFSRHRRFEYEIRAALGVQYLSNETSPIFPTQPLLSPGGFYAGSVDTGPNYNFSVRLGYKMAPHWYFEALGTANNSQNFATQTVGFTVRYLVHRLPANTDLHVNSIPDWRGRQPFSLQ